MPTAAEPLLALETSGMGGEVALALSGAIVAQQRLPGLRRNAAELIPAIQEMLAVQAMRVRDIEFIAFSAGPGSFTGVRVAATVARMLHSVVRARVVRVSTMEAIAENVVIARESAAVCGMDQGCRSEVAQAGPSIQQPGVDERHADVHHILTMLDAKRGQVYAAGYAIDSAQLREVAAARVIDPAAFLRAISEIAALEKWLAVGECVAIHRELLAQAGVRVAQQSIWKPTASAVARCGLRAIRNRQFAGISEMLPIYLRPPECEEVYESRRKAAIERRGEGPLSGAPA